MYPNDCDAQTWQGPWRDFLATAIGELRLVLDSDPGWTAGVRAFDRLTEGQKTWLLATVGRAMLVRDEIAPDLTQAVEATVAALFATMRAAVAHEIKTMPSVAIVRRIVLAVLELHRIPPDPELEPLPEETSTDKEAWSHLIETLEESFLFDYDYAIEDIFADAYPAITDPIKESMDIPNDFFSSAPPDPDATQLVWYERILEELDLWVSDEPGDEEDEDIE